MNKELERWQMKEMIVNYNKRVYNTLEEYDAEVRRRHRAHVVEWWSDLIGGTLLIITAAVFIWLYCAATPDQFDAEHDWSAAETERAEQ